MAGNIENTSDQMKELGNSISTTVGKVTILAGVFSQLTRAFPIDDLRKMEVGFGNLQRSLLATKKEIDGLRGSVKELSSVTAYYSKDVLTQLSVTLKASTSSLAAFNLNTKELSKTFVQTYKRDAPEYLKLFDQLNQKIPTLGLRMKSAAADSSTLFEIFKNAGPQGVSAYLTAIGKMESNTEDSIDNLDDLFNKFFTSFKNQSISAGDTFTKNISGALDKVGGAQGLGEIGFALSSIAGLGGIALGGRALGGKVLGGFGGRALGALPGIVGGGALAYGFSNPSNMTEAAIGLAGAGGAGASLGSVFGQATRGAAVGVIVMAFSQAAQASIGAVLKELGNAPGVSDALLKRVAEALDGINKQAGISGGDYPDWIVEALAQLDAGIRTKILGENFDDTYLGKVVKARQKASEKAINEQAAEDLSKERRDEVLFGGKKYEEELGKISTLVSTGKISMKDAESMSVSLMSKQIKELDKTLSGESRGPNLEKRKELEETISFKKSIINSLIKEGNEEYVKIFQQSLKELEGELNKLGGSTKLSPEEFGTAANKRGILISNMLSMMDRGMISSDAKLAEARAKFQFTGQTDIAAIAQGESVGELKEAVVARQEKLVSLQKELSQLKKDDPQFEAKSAQLLIEQIGLKKELIDLKTVELQAANQLLDIGREENQSGIAYNIAKGKNLETIQRGMENEVDYIRDKISNLTEIAHTTKDKNLKRISENEISRLQAQREQVRLQVKQQDQQVLESKVQTRQQMRSFLGPVGVEGEIKSGEEDIAALKERIKFTAGADKIALENKQKLLERQVELNKQLNLPLVAIERQSRLLAGQEKILQSMQAPAQVLGAVRSQMLEKEVEQLDVLRRNLEIIKVSKDVQPEQIQKAEEAILDSQAKIAGLVDVQRRTFAEQFSSMVINMPSGSYLNPTQISDLAMQGPGYTTGRSMRGESRGTYAQQMAARFGEGIDERAPWEKFFDMVMGPDGLKFNGVLSGKVRIDERAGEMTLEGEIGDKASR